MATGDESAGAQTTLGSHSLRRRVVALVLALLGPGLGHYSLGATGAALRWAAAFLVAFAVLVGAGLAGMPILVWASAAAAVLVQVAAAGDVFRRRMSVAPSSARVALVSVAVLVGLEVLRAGIREHVLESFRLPAKSMYPTLLAGDHVLVSKLHREPSPGDLIVYREAGDRAFVKRVVAVGDDRVEIRGNAVSVAGKPLPHIDTTERCELGEPCKIVDEAIGERHYKIATALVDFSSDARSGVVPSGHVFVLGDARDWSRDSRMDGAIPLENVVGTAKLIWWPLGRRLPEM